MAVAVTGAISILNPEFIAYHIQETTIRAAEQARSIALDIATGVQLAAQLAQITSYYNDADDAIDERDIKIQAQIDFMQTLEDLKDTQDLPMINCKKDILTDLEDLIIDKCDVVGELSTPSVIDGQGVINKTLNLADESCGGIPSGWKFNEGALYAAKAGSYVGGISANSESRRAEAFRSSRLSLTRSAHSGLKSIYNAGDVLSQYTQAASIHSGLADLFIQGFNSAGAALGASFGRLATGTGVERSVSSEPTSEGSNAISASQLALSTIRGS